MNHISDTLTKAFSYIEETGQPFAFENNCILCMLISPSRIQDFSNNDLYLKYIKNIIQERGNISFPERKESYNQYFQDCITLKNLMEKTNPVFPKEYYLSDTIRLLENLKTPYYQVFSKTLLHFISCFSDRTLFEKTLKEFYSVIIRSSDEKLKFIQMIAEHSASYRCFPFIKEALLSEILSHNLSLFTHEKNFWLSELAADLYHIEVRNTEELEQEAFLKEFLKKEHQFLQEAEHQSLFSKETISLASYLSLRSLWFSNQKEEPSQNVLFQNDNTDLHGQAVQSTFLNTFAYNMTARTYITNPAIGREQEIRDLELILISPKKSPILLGEAGVGKTSVVEGLSYCLQREQTPELLKHKKIFKLTTTSLLSGTKYVGEMEDRIKQLMTELEKNPDVILFIDEIHTIVGAGSTESSNNDISNMLKPYIDRGDIKIIGSTTFQEYKDYLLPDKALARRFYPITIEEPDEKMTLQILEGTIPSIEYETKVKHHFSKSVLTSVLKELIQLSAGKNQPADRSTRLPELPLTLLEMAFSYAALDSRHYLTKQDLVQSVRHTNLLKKEIRQKADQFFSFDF